MPNPIGRIGGQMATIRSGLHKLFKLALKFSGLGFAGLAMVFLGMGLAVAQTAEPRPLAADDVSILFPPPKNVSDLDNLIALTDLMGPTGAPQLGRLWSNDDFGRFLQIAEDPNVQVAGAGLRFGFASRRQTSRYLVYRRHPHRSRCAGIVERNHRAVRPTAADTLNRPTSDAPTKWSSRC